MPCYGGDLTIGVFKKRNRIAVFIFKIVYFSTRGYPSSTLAFAISQYFYITDGSGHTIFKVLNLFIANSTSFGTLLPNDSWNASKLTIDLITSCYFFTFSVSKDLWVLVYFL